MANEMRLIDANEFNKKIEHIPMWGSVASYMLEHFPTVDAKPVVHGRWERISWWQHKKRYEMDKCTVCGHQVKPKDARYFCPNCGADMRDGDGNA